MRYLLLTSIFLLSCKAEPEPLHYGKDACHACKMTLMDKKFGSELVTKKGKVYKFDDTNCMLNFMNSDALQGEEIAFNSEYTNINDNVYFEWKAEGNTNVFCTTCPETGALPLNDGFYTLSMSNEEGCIVSDVVYVRVKKDRSVYHPNIISANGDLMNDVFFLSGNALSADGMFLRIFDRWGNKVFESGGFQLNQASFGWDGTFLGSPVLSGVYTWTAGLKYIDGFEQMVRGDITVIK